MNIHGKINTKANRLLVESICGSQFYKSTYNSKYRPDVMILSSQWMSGSVGHKEIERYYFLLGYQKKQVIDINGFKFDKDVIIKIKSKYAAKTTGGSWGFDKYFINKSISWNDSVPKIDVFKNGIKEFSLDELCDHNFVPSGGKWFSNSYKACSYCGKRMKE